MASTTFLSCLLLMLAACHVVSSNESVRKVAMHYQVGDWRPHFGYFPGHMSSKHRHSNRNRKREIPVARIQSKEANLDDFAVSLVHKKKVVCSGILLDAQDVLVPKTCVSAWPPAELEVQLIDGTLHAVASIASSTRFTIDQAEGLLAELKLANPLKKQILKPPFCRRLVPLGAPVEQWSWDKQGMFLIKKHALQVAEDSCKHKLDDLNGLIVTAGISCVENTKMTGNCEVTYGLPYVWNGSFCGMKLMGHNCPTATSVDVYVRLLKVQSYMGASIRKMLKFSQEDDFF